MKILIYLAHPAQFHFFKNAIDILKLKGNELKVLIKSKDILEDLLVSHGMEYSNVQVKLRKNNYFSIFFALIERTFKILTIASKFKPNILIGTDASVSYVGMLIGKPTITTLEDDYEVIKNLANLAYPVTSHILVPEVCGVGKWTDKKIGYRGYMKLAYLHPGRFKADKSVKSKYISVEKFCLIRMSKLAAHHDIGIRALNVEFIQNIIQSVESRGFLVYLSTEGKVPDSLMKYELKVKPEDIHHVMAFASLLISDSQSMSVEAALLGVPSVRISDFAGRISVLEELEHKYGLTFGYKIDQKELIMTKINELLDNVGNSVLFKQRKEKMLLEKIDVSAFLIWFIEEYPQSVQTIRVNPDYQNRFIVRN